MWIIFKTKDSFILLNFFTFYAKRQVFSLGKEKYESFDLKKNKLNVDIPRQWEVGSGQDKCCSKTRECFVKIQRLQV